MVGLVMMALLLGGLVQCASSVQNSQEEAAKALEGSLLQMLGLSKRPKPTGKLVVPPEMLELYRRQANLETATLSLPGRQVKTANTARSFTHSGAEKRSKRSDRFRLHFNISDIPKEERVTAAELNIWVDDGARRVSVHDIIRPGVKGKRKPLLRLLDSKKVEGNTVSLDVMPAAERWSSQSGHNHGLLVEISTEKSRTKRDTGTSLDSHTLLMYLDDGKNQMRGLDDMLARSRRAAQGKKRSKEGDCRRHNLKVDFKDVGWDDWIVAPPGYDAYYCHGKCPFPLSDDLNSTNHAVVQTLMNSVNPGAVPKACCVPTQLSSISMLYLDDNKVVLKNYQDMAVVGCGCR